MLRQDHIHAVVFIAVLSVQFMYAAPFGRAVFYARSSVMPGRIVQRNAADIQQQKYEHETQSIRSPADVLRTGVCAETEKLKNGHSVLIDAGRKQGKINDGKRKQRPHIGAVFRSVIHLTLSFLRSRCGTALSATAFNRSRVSLTDGFSSVCNTVKPLLRS